MLVLYRTTLSKMWKTIITVAVCIAAVSALPTKHVKKHAPLVPRLAHRAGSSDNHDGRIVGGEDAAEGQFPYQVYMEVMGFFQCGGSLIDPDWVLTAAHCVSGVNAGSVTVTAGDHILSDTSGEEQRISAAELIGHEDFGFIALKNDIALIRLSSSVDITGNVATIPLATAGPAFGESVIISGWGKTTDTSDVADVLQFADVFVEDAVICDQYYINNVDSGSQICFSTENGKSSCNGDSGGPMVPTDQSVVYGITSFGSSVGCESGAPGVYTNVAGFLDWIDTQMKA